MKKIDNCENSTVLVALLLAGILLVMGAYRLFSWLCSRGLTDTLTWVLGAAALVLAALGLHTRQAAPAAAKQPAPLSDTERRVLAGIGPKPVGIEELCVSTGLPMSALLGTLMKLEITGRVYKQPGQRYVLR